MFYKYRFPHPYLILLTCITVYLDFVFPDFALCTKQTSASGQEWRSSGSGALLFTYSIWSCLNCADMPITRCPASYRVYDVLHGVYVITFVAATSQLHPLPPCDCHFKAWKFIYCIMGKVLHFSHDLPPSPRRPCSSPSPSCAIQLAAFHLMQRPKDVRKQGGRIQDSGSRDPSAKSGASSAKLFCPNPVGFFSPPNSNSKSTLCRGNGSKVYGHVRLFGARKSGGKSGNSTGVGRSLALPLHLFIFLHSVLFRCAQDV